MPMFRAIAAAVGFATGTMMSARRHATEVFAAADPHAPSGAAVFTDKYRPFHLGEVINLAEDVAIFRFLTPNVDDVFYLPVSSTLQVCTKRGGNIVDNVTRMYTPITPNGTRGYFDILVKKQPKGRMTETLFGMSIGDTIQMRKAEYSMRYVPNKFQHIGMIGGGTGITPLLQVMRAATSNPDDRTKLSLLYANRTERKILLEGVLNELEKNPRLKCHYTVDAPVDPASWKGYVGHITKEMIKETMPPPAPGNYLMVCGPDAMLESIVGAKAGVMQFMSGGRAQQPAATNANNVMDVGGILMELGYTRENVFRF